MVHDAPVHDLDGLAGFVTFEELAEAAEASPCHLGQRAVSVQHVDDRKHIVVAPAATVSRTVDQRQAVDEVDVQGAPRAGRGGGGDVPLLDASGLPDVLWKAVQIRRWANSIPL